MALQLETEKTRRAKMFVVALLVIVLVAGSTMLTPLYGVYQQKIGFSQITLTLIYASYVLGNLGALLFLGRVSDSVGRRPVAMASIGIMVIAALIFSGSHSVGELDVGRVLSGLGVGAGSGAASAWLVELAHQDNKASAATILTSANFIGLGVGALIAGALADFAPWPLQTPFAVYLFALVAIGFTVWRLPETVRKTRPLHTVSVRPRLSVPDNIRARFVAPAIALFGSMSLVGYYACLAPGILVRELHITNHLTAGALFFELAIVAAATIVITRWLPSRTAMLAALMLMIPAVWLVVAAQFTALLFVLIGATTLCGVAAALGFRGSLQVVNEIAPPDRRAEMVAVLFLCGFIGNALPVIGIGVLTSYVGPVNASLAFGVMMSVFALTAIWFGLRNRA